MVKLIKLTPEALITAPRRGPAVPNGDGSLCLFTESTHAFRAGTTTDVRVLNVASNTSIALTNEEGVQNAQWIPGTRDDIIYLKSGDKGITQVIVGSGSDVDKERYVAATFSAPVSNLKLKELDDGVAFVVTGLIGDNGALYNEKTSTEKSTARIFDTPAIRNWNEVYRAQRFTLWYNKLIRKDGKWCLSGSLIKLIDDPDLEAPYGMYGGNAGDNFAISRHGIATAVRNVSARQPTALMASIQLFVALDSFTSGPSSSPQRISSGDAPNSSAASNMRFSPDGETIAYQLKSMGDLYNDKIFFASTKSLVAHRVIGGWESSRKTGREPPMAFEFAGSSSALIIQSEWHGRSNLDYVDLNNNGWYETFYRGGVVSGFHALRKDRWDEVVVSSSTLISSSIWQRVGIKALSSPATACGPLISVLHPSVVQNGRKFGLHEGMVKEFWFNGGKVHSFMVVPSDFDPTKKYPFVVRPHGGPVSSWSDSWMVAANFATWAEEGYVVIVPNISGSIGYGVDFARRVNDSWGGNPFRDLLALMDHLSTIEFLHQDKAVLVGGSYGAYMISWCLGHDIINKFCCAVWHDGIFNIPSFNLQTDLIINDGSFGSSTYPWDNMDALQAYNPARPELLRKWKNAPPTIIIHSEKDYRCPITEGIAAFNTLHAMGVPSRFLTFSDEGHIVEDPENSLQWYRVVFDWARRCVNGDITRGSTKW